MLCVIDGAKALAAGIKKVFGDHARVQRCTLHKRRNLGDHLPKELAETVDRREGLKSHPRMGTCSPPRSAAEVEPC